MNQERIAELRIEALNAKYAGKEFSIPASEAMEILDLAMNQLEPRVTPEMWKELGRIEAERTTAQDEVLTKIPRFNIDVDAGGDDIQEVPYPAGDFCRFEDVQAAIAAMREQRP